MYPASKVVVEVCAPFENKVIVDLLELLRVTATPILNQVFINSKFENSIVFSDVA
jgi:hypothetical protein